MYSENENNSIVDEVPIGIVEPPTAVYVRTNSFGIIVEINSGAFINPDESWIKIDEGYGDKYVHAQGNYFSTPIMSMDGTYTYKLVDGKVVKRNDDDKAPEYNELLNRITINQLKQRLAETDSIDSEIAEGVASADDYADEIAIRQNLRRQLDELKSMVLIGR